MLLNCIEKIKLKRRVFYVQNTSTVHLDSTNG